MHTMYFDGCSKGNPGRAGAGAAIFNKEGEIIAVDAYSVALNSDCKFRGKNSGVAISAPSILESLKREYPQLASELLAP